MVNFTSSQRPRPSRVECKTQRVSDHTHGAKTYCYAGNPRSTPDESDRRRSILFQVSVDGEIYSPNTSFASKMILYEELHEDPDVDSRGDDLHVSFCSRQAQLPKDRQKLSDERRQRMQLRQKLRLRHEEVS